MGIQSFLIFGDICQQKLKDTGYFVKNIMGYGILGPPPLPGPHVCMYVCMYGCTYGCINICMYKCMYMLTRIFGFP